jgi:hypothetical protein
MIYELMDVKELNKPKVIAGSISSGNHQKPSIG